MDIYYVYAYINKSTNLPYYIGKGKGNRAYCKHTNVSTPKDKSKIVFLETNLTEIGALSIERRMIRWYGRKQSGGILLNQLEGGDNPPLHTGKIRSESHKKAISISKKGKKRPESDRRAISLGKIGKKIGPASESRKQAISQAKKGKRWFKNKEETKCVCCLPNQKPKNWVPGMIKKSNISSI
jgi:hypothetical protein